MPEPVLLVDRRDGIATLTLNRPDQMNALSLELRRALESELVALRSEPEIGVVILTGAGRRRCSSARSATAPARAPAAGDRRDQRRGRHRRARDRTLL
jgi:enoyl-CoA hydratase/carnithine racemase